MRNIYLLILVNVFHSNKIIVWFLNFYSNLDHLFFRKIFCQSYAKCCIDICLKKWWDFSQPEESIFFGRTDGFETLIRFTIFSLCIYPLLKWNTQWDVCVNHNILALTKIYIVMLVRASIFTEREKNKSVKQSFG